MTLAPRPRENDVQRAVIGFLEAVVPGVFIFAIPNAARRNRGGKAGNAVPGLKPGMPDLGFLCRQYPGVTFYPEIKRPGESTSDAQDRCHQELQAIGAKVAIVDSVEEMRQVLAWWNIDTREVA